MLVRNCVSYMNYVKKINSDVSCKFVLHFNEETNEVEAKQGPAPELWIEMGRMDDLTDNSKKE